MPNWCDNNIGLTHSDSSKIDELEATLSGVDKELFNHLRPRPKDQDENWYDWQCENWGTKWDASINDWNRDGANGIWISCSTPWHPPIALYEFLIEEGWEVDALYNEQGMGYCGTWKSGVDDMYEYDSDDLESLEQLTEELQEFTGLIDYYNQRKADGEFDD